MNKWYVSAELFSLILMVVLMLNYFERRWHGHPTRKLYGRCLRLSTLSILLNIICATSMQGNAGFADWVFLLVNSVYFFSVVSVCSTMAYYIAQLLFEHVQDRRHTERLNCLLVLLTVGYLALLLYNIGSGVVFSIADGRYVRGPLINAGYMVMLVELAGLICLSIRYRGSISAALQRVMKILPPTLLLLTAYQIYYPDVLFNGGLIVAANIILMFNLQNRRVEQDALTGAGNRHSFYEELKLQLGGGQKFQVVLVAIRQFNTVNVSYGHQQGDALLCQVTRWLQKQHRQGRVFRVTNLDLALLVPYTDEDAAQALYDRVRRRFDEPWLWGDAEIALRACFTELIWTGQSWTATDILEFLSYSIGEAARREDRSISFGDEIYQQIGQRDRLLALLQSSIQQQRAEVWYQPIYRCADGRFASAEALVRLRDETGALVSPALFVPVAERYGLLNELTCLVLQEACRFLGSGVLPEDFSISVNLTMDQFLSDCLVQRLEECLERNGCPVRRLKLEITEQTMAEDMELVARRVKKLTELGICLCMDDFGIGYSNLSAVLGCGFPIIKLDQSLVADYPDREQSVTMVDAMLRLFHTMGSQVVVEGVETEQQAQALMERGADFLQGFYYAKPMPREELLARLGQEAA